MLDGNEYGGAGAEEWIKQGKEIGSIESCNLKLADQGRPP